LDCTTSCQGQKVQEWPQNGAIQAGIAPYARSALLLTDQFTWSSQPNGINPYFSIRGREQQLINQAGGPRSNFNGMFLTNRINAINFFRVENPIYMNAARDNWGSLPNNSSDIFWRTDRN
jgi:hypothetical protein